MISRMPPVESTSTSVTGPVPPLITSTEPRRRASVITPPPNDAALLAVARIRLGDAVVLGDQGAAKFGERHHGGGDAPCRPSQRHLVPPVKVSCADLRDALPEREQT